MLVTHSWELFKQILLITLLLEMFRGWYLEYIYTLYSQTSLIRTSKGPNQESASQRCPYCRGRECMIFGISGTKRTVRNREVQYLYGEVRLYVHFIKHP